MAGAAAALGMKGWMAMALTSTALLVAATAGLAGLTAYIQSLPEGKELAKLIKTCDKKCPSCYKCLSKYTGQDLSMCTGTVIPIVFECFEQVIFLYGRPQSLSEFIPCYKKCRKCRNCLENLQLGLPRLTNTLWETVFPEFFDDPNAEDNGNGDDESSDDDDDDDDDDDESDNGDKRRKRETHVFANKTLIRRKRQYQIDGDACCQTQRFVQPYVQTHRDFIGLSWFPVWFHDPIATPEFRFQLTDEITCPLSASNCDPSLTCRKHEEPRTLLFTREEPHPQTGHTYVFLMYPSDRVKFIDIDRPCYCRCTN